jgi:type I restriction enzyme M protein
VAIGDDPRALIETLSEDLLQRFADAPLLDKYDIYQLLLDYWQDTLQDDIYLLVQDGWQAARDLRELKVETGQKLRETPNLVYKRQKFIADLIPPELIVERFYLDQKHQTEQLERDAAIADSELESLIEGHGSEDGCLADVLSDTGKLLKGKLKKGIKEADAADKAILVQVRDLLDSAANGKKAVKVEQEKLTALTLNHYAKLSDSEIKSLLLDDKWRQSLYSSVRSAVHRVTQQLAERVKLIEERYAAPLPEIEKSVEDLSGAVEEHLRTMGIQW